MKKILIIMVLIFGIFVTPIAYAKGGNHHGWNHYSYRHHNNGWETAGVVLVGAVGLAIIADALTRPNYSQPCYPTYYNDEPIYVQPPYKVWVDGYYANVAQQVWVPSYYEQRWVAPIYDWVWTQHGRQKVMIKAGCYENILIPGFYKTQYVKIWVSGHWE